MMNERIKELAAQAGFAVWGDAVFMYDPKDTLDATVVKKFAESIVRECVAQVRKDENGPAYEAAGRIAEHFGIE
tara:strand:+ start:797 stop:1018 length:222 start_codon:yes stop_codon:yes gene_type:complete